MMQIQNTPTMLKSIRPQLEESFLPQVLLDLETTQMC